MTKNESDLEALEAELDDMPMMAVDLTGAILLVADAFDLDALWIVDQMIADPSWGSNDRELQLICDLIWEAVDSSTYLPWIKKSLEVNALITELQE